MRAGEVTANTGETRPRTTRAGGPPWPKRRTRSSSPRWPRTSTATTLSTLVFDVSKYQVFSPESATVVFTYITGQLGIVVWNLEPGQENDYHLHPTTEHLHVVLEGECEYTLGDIPARDREAGPGGHGAGAGPARHPQRRHGAGVVHGDHQPGGLREGPRRPSVVTAPTGPWRRSPIGSRSARRSAGTCGRCVPRTSTRWTTCSHPTRSSTTRPSAGLAGAWPEIEAVAGRHGLDVEFFCSSSATCSRLRRRPQPRHRRLDLARRLRRRGG